MAKRKFWVESISRYIGSITEGGVIYEVDIKINGDMNQAETDLTGKTNTGGQAWDYANSNWDEFVPEEGPVILAVEGEQVTKVPTKLRWACITGVYSDKKGKNHLPITEVGYKSGQNTGYGKTQKQKRGKATPKFKTKEDSTAALTQRVNAELKDQITSKHPPKLPRNPKKTKVKERKELCCKVPVVPSNPLDMDAIRAAKIAKVLEEEA